VIGKSVSRIMHGGIHGRADFIHPVAGFRTQRTTQIRFSGAYRRQYQQRGSEVTLPYYWNIAPNLDATISPRVMTKRV